MDLSRARAYCDSRTGLWIIRGVFCVVLVMSMVMLFSPASDVPSGFPLNDKVVHSLLFFALGLTAWVARLASTVTTFRALIVYAGVSEILQAWLPIGRYGSLADFAADIAGLLLALLVVWLVGHIASAEHREETQ
ncbi:MAG TPA: hypothetical protein P5108_02650 [Marmoricola sp.]|nr:hypothetical protein [Nocardioidaceae bacterium]MCO5324889.1 hypothetical protein [Nocardioidaceae bacterium]HRV68325.1 hypothetical protein [Marmoricola sp.]